MEHTRIVLVGGGLSGTLTAIHLLKAAREKTTVYLLEKDAGKMNRGVAYSSSLPFQPLNVPAYRMSLFLDQPHDFVEWLQENRHRYPKALPQPVTPDDFIPRHIFGDYVADQLLHAEAGASRNVRLVRVPKEAVALQQCPGSSDFLVTLQDGSQLEAQKVVLAFGNLAPTNVPIPNQSFYQSRHYQATPWATEVLETLPREASVLLIGSSLTMVDLVGSLAAKGHTGPLHVISRHGMVPRAHYLGTQPYPIQPLQRQGHLTPLEVLRAVRQEIRKATAEGYTWHSVVDALRESIPVLWQNFTLAEKKQFLRHVRPYWEVHRHRMPHTSAQLLQALQQKGQLDVRAAALVNMQENGTKAQVQLRERRTHQLQTLEVDLVINCTGPLCDYTKSHEPLVKNLLSQGLICPDALRMGLSAAPSGNLLSSDGFPVENLYTLGPPLKSEFYESTALREIRQQAAALAGLLLSGETMLAAL
ncbi:FAD/NAD(P)-binding protein [Rufibacter sediminis]|uniref:FAD/NAD(P)-binding protein n=1 Tax=Rufibacter sediminis TaxID=2762756 RepID=A0ABR6VWZ0_9BACT|nr:FAD/NAD(P)-binding protein [Rufibacter sediminis]MBC3541434.1 FAD/NAD(P)-binding protein [Rufibacter sediminis]